MEIFSTWGLFSKVLFIKCCGKQGQLKWNCFITFIVIAKWTRDITSVFKFGLPNLGSSAFLVSLEKYNRQYEELT